MKHEDKTKEQLIDELAQMRQRLTDLEALEPERKRAEEALRESEEKYRFLVDNSKEIALIISKSGKILFANRIVLTSFGYPEEEIIGKSITKFITKDFIKKVLPALAQEFLGHPQPEMEVQIKAKSGEIRYLEIDKGSTPVHEKGKLIGVLIGARDITERKRAEETLHDSQEQYRGIFDSATESFLIFDFNGNIVEANPQACKMYGYPHEELIKFSGKDIVSPDYYHLFEQFKRDVQTTGEFHAESVDVHKDGTTFNVEVKGGIFDYKGKPHLLAVIRDITDRKLAEEALRESEEKYQSLVESTEDSIYLLDRNCKYLFMNKKNLSRLGLEAEKPIGRKYSEFHSEDDTKDLIGKAERVFETGKSLYYEYRSQRDGRYFLRTLSPVKEPGGNTKAITVISKEITERKQSEEELLESENKYKALTESSLTGIFIHQNGKYVFVNDKFAEIHGYKNEELLGKDHLALIHPDEREFVKQTREKRLKGKTAPHSYEVKRLRKDGETIWCEMMATVIQHRGRPAIMGNVIDITDRKQAEEALKQSEEKYRTILESIEEGYYEVDIAGNSTFVNDSLCKILGYPRDEIIAINNRKYMDEENARRVYQDFNRVYKTGKPTKIVDWEIIRKDTTKRYVETSVSLMKDAEDTPAGFRGIVRDITEKKLLESQLLQAQRMESIGTLAGGIAHNFNNLLMGIQGNTSLMLLDTDPHHPHHERLTNIEKSVQSGSKLTSQLLGYARGGRYEVRPISLNQLVKETSDTFDITKKDITVHQDLDKDLLGIIADQGQIEQVLLNIYVNAADAMPQGGDLFLKTMNVTHKDMSDKPYKVKPGNYVLLIVRDTGIGMDKEIKERIFEPFFTTKGLARGTGLGLASVYGIIKSHGGYTDVESKKGHGTTFSLYLPATKAEGIAQRAASERSAEILQGKETVLLVDDEEMILDVGQELLKTLDYKVLIANGGKEALEIVSKAHGAKRMEPEEKGRYAPGAMPFAIDLVILDMIMPVIGGGETYDRMKEINPDIKVLLSSGYSIDGQATEILKRGCNGFIQKPFSIKELSQGIREILEEK